MFFFYQRADIRLGGAGIGCDMTDCHDTLLMDMGADERVLLMQEPFYADLEVRPLSMGELFKAYSVRRHFRLAEAREAGGEHFAYQIVWLDGEKTKRNYICFGTAREAVRFFLEWRGAQVRSACPKPT